MPNYTHDLTDADIGSLVTRHGDRNARYHLIQSVVDGAAVVKCGKTMAARDRRGNELVLMHGDPTCAYCWVKAQP